MIIQPRLHTFASQRSSVRMCFTVRPVIVAGTMAKVTVKMFATIREAAATSEIEVEANSLGEVLTVLKTIFGRRMRAILEQAEKDPDRIVVLVNGINVSSRGSAGAILRDGDEVSVFPPVSGG